MRRFAFGFAAAGSLAVLSGCGPSYSPNTYNAAAVQQANTVQRGIVIGVRPVKVSANDTVGTVTGAAAGGIAGSTVGDSGTVKALSALGGSVVGGIVGSGVQHLEGDTNAFEYIVRENNNNLVSVTQRDKVSLPIGQKVLVIAGKQARIVADYTVSLPDQQSSAPATPDKKARPSDAQAAAGMATVVPHFTSAPGGGARPANAQAASGGGARPANAHAAAGTAAVVPHSTSASGGGAQPADAKAAAVTATVVPHATPASGGGAAQAAKAKPPSSSSAATGGGSNTPPAQAGGAAASPSASATAAAAAALLGAPMVKPGTPAAAAAVPGTPGPAAPAGSTPVPQAGAAAAAVGDPPASPAAGQGSTVH